LCYCTFYFHFLFCYFTIYFCYILWVRTRNDSKLQSHSEGLTWFVNDETNIYTYYVWSRSWQDRFLWAFNKQIAVLEDGCYVVCVCGRTQVRQFPCLVHVLFSNLNMCRQTQSFFFFNLDSAIDLLVFLAWSCGYKKKNK
jgi:hypothetical protein